MSLVIIIIMNPHIKVQSFFQEEQREEEKRKEGCSAPRQSRLLRTFSSLPVRTVVETDGLLPVSGSAEGMLGVN